MMADWFIITQVRGSTQFHSFNVDIILMYKASRGEKTSKLNPTEVEIVGLFSVVFLTHFLSHDYWT